MSLLCLPVSYAFERTRENCSSPSRLIDSECCAFANVNADSLFFFFFSSNLPYCCGLVYGSLYVPIIEDADRTCLTISSCYERNVRIRFLHLSIVKKMPIVLMLSSIC